LRQDFTSGAEQVLTCRLLPWQVSRTTHLTQHRRPASSY